MSELKDAVKIARKISEHTKAIDICHDELQRLLIIEINKNRNGFIPSLSNDIHGSYAVIPEGCLGRILYILRGHWNDQIKLHENCIEELMKE